MKKLLCVICALFLMGMMSICFVAEASEVTSDPIGATAIDVVDTPAPDEPMTWAYLATIAGATAATLLIVQFLKVPLDKVWKIPTRAFVYVIALLLLLTGTYFTTGLTVEAALLTAVNAVIVALAAYGSYEVTFAKLGK